MTFQCGAFDISTQFYIYSCCFTAASKLYESREIAILRKWFRDGTMNSIPGDVVNIP